MKNKYIYFLIASAILLFIWLNSLLPISISGGMSDRIAEIIRGLPFMGFVSGELIRKLAHAAEFGVFGIVTAVFLRNDLIKRLPLVAFCGLITAVIDETIQLFAAGRGSRITDVWIDFGGFSLGIFIVCTIVKIKNKSKGIELWKKR